MHVPSTRLPGARVFTPCLVSSSSQDCRSASAYPLSTLRRALPVQVRRLGGGVWWSVIRQRASKKNNGSISATQPIPAHFFQPLVDHPGSFSFPSPAAAHHLWQEACLNQPVFPSPSSSAYAALHAAQQQQPLVLSRPAAASSPPSSSALAIQEQQRAPHQPAVASSFTIPTPSSPSVVPAAAPAARADSPGKNRPRPKDPHWGRTARVTAQDESLARPQRLRAKEFELRRYGMDVCVSSAQ